jgi:hypothetical protein
MPKKVKFKDVYNFFSKSGYILLSTEYINCDAKLKYKCPNGHIHSISWSNFRRGVRCAKCSGNAKLTLGYIKEYFSQQGYTLLSKAYVNDHTHLKFNCDKGHTSSMSWNNFKAGKRCVICAGNNKGGVTKLNIPLYETFFSKLSPYYEVVQKTLVIANKEFNVVGVRCINCDTVFVPTTKAIYARLSSLTGNSPGENHLYCSDKCKKDCSVYRQVKYPKNNKPYITREVQKQLKSLRLEKDNFRCQVCFSHVNLECHHLDGVELNPVESADIDRCIILCRTCHKDLHKIPGYTYSDFKRKSCI